MNKVKINRKPQGDVASLNTKQNTTALLTQENSHQHHKMDIEEEERGKQDDRSVIHSSGK